MQTTSGDLIRIGELSRRTGVSPDLLRVWERRYSLLEPVRTPGGFRLYGERDLERVARMTARIADGFPASVAARLAVAAGGLPDAGDASPPPGKLMGDLHRALAGFDEVAANAAFDRALSCYSLPTALGEIVIPFLQKLGRQWESGAVSIAQEHFATSIVRGRLLGVARGWGTGTGPVALLACPPSEFHDLGLIAFGLVLREHGWRIVMLGPNTPIGTLADAAGRLAPALVVVSSMQSDLMAAVQDELADLGSGHRVALAGHGATAALARRTGGRLISASPTDGAIEVAAGAAGIGGEWSSLAASDVNAAGGDRLARDRSGH